MNYSLSFPVEPIPKGRPRAARKGRYLTLYTPSETKTYERILKVMAKELFKGPPLDCPLIVSCVFTLSRPSSVKRPYPCKKPDLDNLLKAALDAMNGILWRDDSQIVEIFASKHYASTSRPVGTTLNITKL